MRRRTLAILFAIAVFGVAWYMLGQPGRPAEHTSSNPTSLTGNGVRGLIVEPDDGRAPIINEIEAARHSIDILMYILSDSATVNSLIAAESKGVEVRVILEQDPYGGFGNPEDVAAQLRASGAEVRWSSSEFAFTHAKTLIFDARVVAILNLNLTRSSFESNREFGVISTWPGDVDQAQGIFDADWDGDPAEIDGSLVVSPTNSRARIMKLIGSANSSLKIYAEVIRDQEFVAKIIDAEKRGVTVQILLSADTDPRWLELSKSIIASGVEIRISSDLYIHAKLILVDDRSAYIGSQNFTLTSMDENREIGIVISESELLTRVAETFRSDFAASNSVR